MSDERKPANPPLFESDHYMVDMDDRDPLPFPQAVPVLTTEITLRDLFALVAMAGVGDAVWYGADDGRHQDVARRCYAQADALLAERERSR